jgi:hypothetical protein
MEVHTCLSAVAPVQKYCMGHTVPAGPDEAGGQKFPGGEVQGFGCAEPPSQYCPCAQASESPVGICSDSRSGAGKRRPSQRRSARSHSGDLYLRADVWDVVGIAGGAESSGRGRTGAETVGRRSWAREASWTWHAWCFRGSLGAVVAHAAGARGLVGLCARAIKAFRARDPGRLFKERRTSKSAPGSMHHRAQRSTQSTQHAQLRVFLERRTVAQPSGQ